MCGGPIGDIVDLGGDILEGAGDIVEGGLDAVGDVGSFVDDAVNDVIPGGWYTVAAIAAPYAIPELGAALGATEAAGTGLATLPESVLSAEAAFGSGAGSLATDAALAAGAGSSGTALGDMAISGLGDVPIEFGDQIGDFPLEGSYGSPTAPGVQEATQNLLDTNVLQELTGSPLEVLGDQPGDFPLEGSYGDPLAPGVQEAAQNLLDANAANALASYTPSPSTISNALKSVLGGGATAGGLTSLGSSSGTSGDTSGIKNLTPGLTHANTDFELAGEPVVHAAGGGGVGSYFNSGLSSSDSSSYNYLDDTYSKLKPGLLKPNINFSLSGMPQGHADGGSIEGHNPQFYSEGGLQHRYVKGEGDGTSDSVPAMLASGEFVIPADVVSGLGNGDNDAGAEVLDEFLSVIRSHKRAADSKDLPEDSKGPLAYLAEAKKKVRA